MISSPAPTMLAPAGSVPMARSGGTELSGFCWVRTLKPLFCSSAMASAEACPRTSGTSTDRGLPPARLMISVMTTVRIASAEATTSQRPTGPPRPRP